MKFIRCICFAIFICAMHILTFGEAAAETLDGSTARTVQNLQGWWQGTGKVHWLNGQVDPFICRVTHIVSDGATKVKQTARCAAAGVSYAGSAHDILPTFRLNWTIAGARITGTWSEEKYGLSGTFEGKVLTDGFEFFAQHELGSGKVRVVVSGCHMDAIAVPDRIIRDAKIQLTKNC